MKLLKKLVDLCSQIQTNDNDSIHVVTPAKVVPRLPPCMLPLPKREKYVEHVWDDNSRFNIWNIKDLDKSSVHYRTVVSILPANAT